MIYANETVISQCDKQHTLESASYVRADDSDYFVVSFADTHIAYVLSTMTHTDDYSTHEVLIAARHATFKLAVAHVDVQYHLDTCENDALLAAMSQAEACCR